MGQGVLTSLVDRLESFGTPASAVHATSNELVAALAPVVQCTIGDPAGLGSAGARAASAIDRIQAWIDAITPAVMRERPAAHLAALRLIPDNLRDHVALCEHATSWQKTRDELNADNALQLRDHAVSRTQDHPLGPPQPRWVQRERRKNSLNGSTHPRTSRTWGLHSWTICRRRTLPLTSRHSQSIDCRPSTK